MISLKQGYIQFIIIIIRLWVSLGNYKSRSTRKCWIRSCTKPESLKSNKGKKVREVSKVPSRKQAPNLKEQHGHQWSGIQTTKRRDGRPIEREKSRQQEWKQREELREELREEERRSSVACELFCIPCLTVIGPNQTNDFTDFSETVHVWYPSPWHGLQQWRRNLMLKSSALACWSPPYSTSRGN